MPSSRTDAYPPLSRFHVGVGPADLIAHIRVSNGDPIPRPLALALQLPDSRQPEFAGIVERLSRQIDLVARLFERDRDVIELHVDACGADAPWRLAHFGDLIDALRHQFHFSTAAASEMTIHADPRVLRPGEIAMLAAAGFNRIALTSGHVDPLLVCACRDGSFRTIAVTVGNERAAPPIDGLEAELDAALALWPDRLTAHAAIDLSRRHDVEPMLANLERAGYVCVGPEQFAVPNDELVTALRAGRLRLGPRGYTPHPECDWLGFGPGAVSHVGECHVRNAEDPVQWRREIDAGRLPVRSGWQATRDDRLRADLMQQLMCRRQIAIRELEESHDIEFRRYYTRELAEFEPWVAAGLARDLGDRIEVGSRGWPWLRKMAACFEICDNASSSRRSALAR